MGTYALAAPAAIIRPFGTTLGGAASRSEIRAVYGGFGLAIAGARPSWMGTSGRAS
jgi:hypothetical protein